MKKIGALGILLILATSAVATQRLVVFEEFTTIY